jgi:diadenosine tetraphosphatase ApaH/serine/threonine PP2A family protein phosphatase
VKTAIISDLHANIEALSVVMEHIASQGVTDLVCLGDVIGYGPNPREALQMTRDARFCLMGNHEEAVMFYGEDFNPKARAALEWTKEQLNSPEHDRTENYELWNFLGNLKETVLEEDILFVHGSPRVPTKEYMVPSDVKNPEKMGEVFALVPWLCFVGHSHIPGVYTEDLRFLSADPEKVVSGVGQSWAPVKGKKALVNVGSVGQPRDGDPRASYVIWDGQKLTFFRLEYDVRKTMDKIYAIEGLPNYLADRLIVGR